MSSYAFNPITGNLDRIKGASGGVSVIEITNDSGTNPVLADGDGNINLLGNGSITTVASSNTSTVELTGLTQYSLLAGAGTPTIQKITPSATVGLPLVSQGSSAYPSYSSLSVLAGGTGATSFSTNGVLISNTTGTGALAAVTLADGEIIVGSTGGAPSATTISAGAGVSIVNGPGSIEISLIGGGAGIDTILADSGSLTPNVSGEISAVGSGSITTVGATNTLTTQLTGLTQYNLLVGQGTTTIGKIVPSATSGIPLISQGSSSYPIYGTTVVAGGGTGSTSFNINGVVISNTTTGGALTSLTLTNGQVVIGSTGSAPVAAALTGTAPVTVTNSAGGIAIACFGGAFVWINTTGTTQTVFASRGYVANNNSTRVAFTMNAVNAGDAFKVVGHGTAGWRLSPASGQRIYLGNSVTTLSTGYIESTNNGDCVELIAVSTTEIRVINWVGNLTVT
jgi:trimeric autotransporter adhesin